MYNYYTVHVLYMYCTYTHVRVFVINELQRVCMCVEMSYTGDDSECCIGNIQGENRFIIQSQYSPSAIDR